MPNETRIYSSLQNLPFTTIIGTLPNTSTVPQQLANLQPGIYEIKISGSMVAGNAGRRNISLGTNVILEWNELNPEQKEVIIFIRITAPTIIQITTPATPTVPLSYQVSYRRTPELNLITSAELDQQHQQLEQVHMQLKQKRGGN